MAGIFIMSNNKIADALDIDGADYTFEDPTKKVDQEIITTGDDESDDYKLSRSTLRSITSLGANALSEILTVAKSSQKARDYEVAADLIKTLAGLTTNMKNLHKKEQIGRMSNLDNENARGENNTFNVEKAVFVGTTAQLLHELKKKDVTPATIVEDVKAE
jgi:hypothetical protein